LGAISGKEANTPVKMFRPNLYDIPQFALPAGYVVRLYEPGDEKTWVEINAAADAYSVITLEKFKHEFGEEMEELKRRCFFLREPGGRDVGTVTAWFNRRYHGRDAGRIHWVAILPEFRGRGLAKPMMSVAMNRLAEFHACAYLSTGIARLVAIRVYLDFNFLPEIESRADLDCWEIVRRKLSHPILADSSLWHRY
jgi:GNAT superfamily N-acetyltransferase